jgi:hypothetical protein
LFGQGFGDVASSRETEVSKFDVRIVVLAHQQKILGLHVAVSNLVGMTVRHGLEHLYRQVTSISLVVGLLFADSIKEIASAHQFHNQEVAVLFLEEIDERHNVWVR